MAGLYPGDAIVAINGQNVKYSPIDEVYEAIKNASKGSKR
jgi:C-terminal processing protease CtpA/Prc